MAIQVRVARSTAGLSSPATVSTTSIAAGDLVLLHVRNQDNVTPTVPAEFTLVAGSEIAGTNSIRVYYKIATGSEGATYSVTFASGTARLGLIAIYSDAGKDLVLDGVASQNNSSSSTNLTCPSITTSIANALMLCFASINAVVTTTAPGSMTKQYDTGGASTIGGFTETLGAAGATGTRVPTASSSATSRTVSMAWAEEQPPAAPSGLGAEAISASRIDLTWTDNSDDEEDFSLERSLDGSTGWTEIATPAADATSYSDTGLSANTTYFYRVRAHNSGGYSSYSGTVHALTLFAANLLSEPHLFLLQPRVVLAARVNWPAATYPIDLFDVDTVTTGAVADALAGMTICLGSTAGGDDYGRQRLRKDGAGARLFVGRSSRGTADGELTVVDNAYVTVWDDRRVWAKIAYIDSSWAIFKDSDIPVEDHTSEPPPVATMGQGYAATIDPDTSVITVLFNGQNSYATADGATITDYLWDIADGTLNVGSALTDDNITATFPAGFRYVSLTITDSNGKTHTTWRPVYARDPDNDDSIDAFRIASRRITDSGQAITLDILDDLPQATYPDGTLALLWDREPTGAANRDHMLIVGWLGSEDNSVGAGKYGLQKDTTLTIEDVGLRMDTLPGFPQTLADDLTRDTGELPAITWNYMPTPTMDKYVHYLLHWHSTLLDVADFIWSGTGEAYRVAIRSSDGESLWRQVANVARAMLPGYCLTCDQAGRVYLLPDPQLQEDDDRTATVQAQITEDDWTEIRFAYQRHPRTHWLRAGAVLVQAGISYNADGSLYLPTVFSIAPGDAPGQGVGEVDNNEGLVASQSVLNSATGHRYARDNARVPRITVTLIQDDAAPGVTVPWRAIEPAYKEWVELTMSAATAARRGLTWTAARCLPLEVNMRYEQSKVGTTRTLEVTLEPESVGEPGQTVTKPSVPAVGDTPVVIPDPIPPPDDGLIGGQELVAGIGETSLYRTADFQTPSGSGGPTWEEVALTADTTLTWVVDPFSPGYIVGSGAINGWRATTTKIYRIEDIFGTPSESAVVTFANTALWRTIQASFGTYFVEGSNPWLICVSYYGSTGGHTGTWATYSLDGGATWAAEVLVSSDYDSGAASNPIGLYCSPKTPGLAYTIAHIETANPAETGGYVSTDWGATWSLMAAEADPLKPPTAWGTYLDSYTFVDSPAVSGSVSSTHNGVRTLAFMPHPPTDAVRVEVSGTYSLAVTNSGSFTHGSAEISRVTTSGLSITTSFGSSVSVGDNESASGSFTATFTRNTSVDWPYDYDEAQATPPTAKTAPYLRLIAGSADDEVTASASLSMRVTEIELEDGTIYLPTTGIFVPIHGQGGEIHLPWEDNDNESVVYYGSLDRTGSPVIGLQRASTTAVDDISQSDYGINSGHFAVRAHDSDRQLVLLAGESGAGNAGVWTSDDAGDTWTEIVTPSATTAYQAAWSGSLDGVVYIWGPAEYMGYSEDSGASIDSRAGNLAALSATKMIGICGGPTA